MNRETKALLLQLAVIGLAGYVGYRVIRGIGKGARDALTDAGSALGSGLFDLFHKDQAGESLFYTVTFQGGAKHAIASRAVDANGFFNYAGKRFRLLIDRSIVSGNNKFAFPA